MGDSIVLKASHGDNVLMMSERHISVCLLYVLREKRRDLQDIAVDSQYCSALQEARVAEGNCGG